MAAIRVKSVILPFSVVLLYPKEKPTQKFCKKKKNPCDWIESRDTHVHAGRFKHTVLEMRFWRRPGGADVCVKMDQIVTVQLGAVGADAAHEHERAAALSSWSIDTNLTPRYYRPGSSHYHQTAYGPIAFPISPPRAAPVFSPCPHASTLGCIKP